MIEAPKPARDSGTTLPAFVQEKVAVAPPAEVTKAEQPVSESEPSEEPIIDKVKLPDTQVGKVYEVEGFYFGFNKTSVYSGETDKLDVLYKLLLHQRHLMVQIQAYTDCRGNAAVNKRVAMQRAASYKKYLVKKGIAGSRIECKWFGTRDPEVSCTPCNSCSEEQHKQNRRIEFMIVGI